MLDLDKYMHNSIKVKALGKELDVLEPSMDMVMQVSRIERDITEENANEKRVETALLFLNHNAQGIEVSREDVCRLPFEAISNLIAEVSAMRYQADQDPN